jgi:hypothetical protein
MLQGINLHDSHCWQAIMVRTKTRMDNCYTRVRTVSDTTVTAHFISQAPPCRDENGSARWSTKYYATCKSFRSLTLQTTRDRYPPTTHGLKDNDTRLSAKTVKLPQTKSTTLSTYLKTTLYVQEHFMVYFLLSRRCWKNKVTRAEAEAINLRAVNYWHQHSIPEPAKYLKSDKIDPTVPRATSFFSLLPSDTSSDSDSETNDNTSPMYSPTSPQ